MKYTKALFLALILVCAPARAQYRDATAPITGTYLDIRGTATAPALAPNNWMRCWLDISSTPTPKCSVSGGGYTNWLGGGGGGGGAVNSVFGRTGTVTSQFGDYQGSQIALAPAGNGITGTNVQLAIEQLAARSGSVSTVFGRVGPAISAQSGDYSATMITSTPTGDVAAATVQAAIAELATEKMSGSSTSSFTGPKTFASSGTPLSIQPAVAPAANTVMLNIKSTPGTSVWNVDYEGDQTVRNLTITGSVTGLTTVSSFNTRTGAVVPVMADYDGFFLTPTEGNTAYAETATGNTFTGDQTINGHVGVNGASTTAAKLNIIGGANSAIKVDRITTLQGTVNVTNATFGFITSVDLSRTLRPGDSLTVSGQTRTINSIGSGGGDVTTQWTVTCSGCAATTTAITGAFRADANGETWTDRALYIGAPFQNDSQSNRKQVYIENGTQTGEATITLKTGTEPINATPKNHVTFSHRTSAQFMGSPATPYTTWDVGMNGDSNFSIQLGMPGDIVFPGKPFWISSSNGSVHVKDAEFRVEAVDQPTGAAYILGMDGGNAQLWFGSNTANGWGLVGDIGSGGAQDRFRIWNPSASANALVIETNSDVAVGRGVRLNENAAAKPTCAAGIRGTFWYTAGATGVNDNVEVCAKDAANAYAWRTIY